MIHVKKENKNYIISPRQSEPLRFINFIASHILKFSWAHGLLLLLLVSCHSKVNITTKDPLTKAVEWIWAQQSEDGGWHSKTHTILQDGKVLTPYILFHLLQLRDDRFAHDEKKVDNAIRFIKGMRGHTDENKPIMQDYPVYSAAFALRVLHLVNEDSVLQKTIVDYLISQQFDEERGFTKDSLVYGGWGFGEYLKFGEHGHVDISHTRRVVEALVESGFMTQEISDKVGYFLKGVQRDTADLRLYKGCIDRKKLPYDGGFIASVVTMSTIKSQSVEIDSAGMHYPSYATATCDGFMAMHALGMQETVVYNDAKKWLIENKDLTTINGLEDDPNQWDEIMHYYHFAVRSEAMSIIDPNGRWKDDIYEILLNEQTPEGFYINPIGGVNKEDDPMMSTIFAIQTLGNRP